MGIRRQVQLISPSGTSLGTICTISNDIEAALCVSDAIESFCGSINRLLADVSCSETVAHDEVYKMVQGVTLEENVYYLTLPSRFNCPHHGFVL